MTTLVEKAAAIIQSADVILVTAGAGMGVDSGHATYRGPEKRMEAEYERLGLTYNMLASAKLNREQPALCWAFYARRIDGYRAATPHRGYELLVEWDRAKCERGFVFTSNVDGYFVRAGFPRERVVEVHGSIEKMQCTKWCGVGLVDADTESLDIDPETQCARFVPACPKCGADLRPNVLMFADGDWDDSFEVAAYTALEDWLDTTRERGRNIAIVECGAGTTIPTVRKLTDRVNEMFGGGRVVRINRHEATAPDERSVALPLSCREALEDIAARLS